SLTATDSATASITGSQTGITVTPASASRLVLAGFPASVQAGTAGSFTVTANDAYGNTATGYRGTLHFSSSDSQASLPGAYTFTPNATGGPTFSPPLKPPGTCPLTATDTATASLTGSQTGISVTAVVSSANGLHITGLPASAIAGTALSLTVSVADANGKTVTGYRGTVHFESNDSQAVLPGDYTFTAGDNGVHTFSLPLKSPSTP